MDYDNNRSGGETSVGHGGGGGGEGSQGTPTRDEKSGGNRLNVGAIGDNVTEDEVRKAFGKYGTLGGDCKNYRGSRDLDEVLEGRTLFAAGIGGQDKEVRKAFGKAGAVKELWLSQNQDSPRFGFIVFDEQSDPEKAISSMNGQLLGGSTLSVGWAKIPEGGIHISMIKYPSEAAAEVTAILKSIKPEEIFEKVAGRNQTNTWLLLFYKDKKVADDVHELLWSVDRCQPRMMKEGET